MIIIVTIAYYVSIIPIYSDMITALIVVVLFPDLRVVTTTIIPGTHL